MKIKIRVPATTANLGSGFDIYGMALALYNSFYFEQAKDFFFSYELEGYAQKTSNHLDLSVKSENLLQENLVLRSYALFFQSIGKETIPVSVRAEIAVPLSRGLGSSATAILAGLFAANEFSRREYHIALKAPQILNLALQVEPHPDNLAAALYGGFCLAIPLEKSFEHDYKIVKIPVRAPIQLAGIIPHFTLSTEKARSVIPKEIDLKTFAYQSSRSALWPYLLSCDGIGEQEKELWKQASLDKIHQNARAQFIPGFFETVKWWEVLGSYSTWLSGAGTTILGFWPKHVQTKVLPLAEKMIECGQAATPFYPEIDDEGLIVEMV